MAESLAPLARGLHHLQGRQELLQLVLQVVQGARKVVEGRRQSRS